MSETCKMCKPYNFKQNYTLELFIALKMANYCWFSWGGNPDFFQKSFIISPSGQSKICLQHLLSFPAYEISHEEYE